MEELSTSAEAAVGVAAGDDFRFRMELFLPLMFHKKNVFDH